MFLGYNYETMRKTLKIFALLLFVLDVQGYAQPQKAKQRASGNQPTTATTLIEPQQTGSPRVEAEHEKNINADVRVVSTPTKDGYDKAPVWINIALAVAGFGAVGIGYLTLKWLKVQTQATQIAARSALRSAIAANAQIKLIKDKERARISVEILPLNTLEFGSGRNRIVLKFNNFGYTHALNVRAEGDARVVLFSNRIRLPGLPRSSHPYENPVLSPPPFEFEDLDIPNVVLANSPAIETWVGFVFPEEWGGEILKRPKAAIEVRGIVQYEDVFGEKHTTKFSYDMRISRWGEVSNAGSAIIRPHSPFSHWFKTIGSPDNEAT